MIYTVKRGHHYSWHLPRLYWNKTSMKAKFKFLDGTWYRMDKEDDFDLSKLLGFSRGLHHKNSIRIGWRPSSTPGFIDLFFYLYCQGHRIIQPFTTVEIGLLYDIEIKLKSSEVTFELKKNGLLMSYTSTPYILPKAKWGYSTGFYIGGNLPARTDTKAYIEII